MIDADGQIEWQIRKMVDTHFEELCFAVVHQLKERGLSEEVISGIEADLDRAKAESHALIPKAILDYRS
jgi:hypothetical protein